MKRQRPTGSALGETSRAQALKDVRWVAEFLGVSEAWVYRAVKAGQLPAVRIVGAIRFDPDAVRNWLKKASAPADNLGPGESKAGEGALE